MLPDVIAQEDGKASGERLSLSRAFPSTFLPQTRNYLCFIDQNYDIRPLPPAREMGKQCFYVWPVQQERQRRRPVNCCSHSLCQKVSLSKVDHCFLQPAFSMTTFPRNSEHSYSASVHIDISFFEVQINYIFNILRLFIWQIKFPSPYD